MALEAIRVHEGDTVCAVCVTGLHAAPPVPRRPKEAAELYEDRLSGLKGASNPFSEPVSELRRPRFKESKGLEGGAGFETLSEAERKVFLEQAAREERLGGMSSKARRQKILPETKAEGFKRPTR